MNVSQRGSSIYLLLQFYPENLLYFSEYNLRSLTLMPVIDFYI